MKKLDKQMIRWYLEKDGEDYQEEMSTIHKGIVKFMRKLAAVPRQDMKPAGGSIPD